MAKIVRQAKTTFTIFAKMVAFIVIVGMSWGLVSIFKLFQGKRQHFGEKSLREYLLKINEARADDPHLEGSTPFLAYFDGKDYKLENDILFGRPKSHHPDYPTALSLYRGGWILPDLYKITAPIRPWGGRLLFQIQEIEPEESFIKWLEILRVIHPADTEIFVDAEYKKYYVLSKEWLSKNVQLPVSVVTSQGRELKHLWAKHSLLGDNALNPLWLNKNDFVELTFTGLDPKAVPHLVVKSWFRDWVLGLEEDWRPRNQNVGVWQFVKGLSRVALVPSLLLVFAGKIQPSLETLSFLPIIFGMADCSGGSSGGSSADGCSFVYEYRNQGGAYRRVAVSEPRAWHFNTEFIEFPKRAIDRSGTLTVRIKASKRHALGFVGVMQDVERVKEPLYEEEQLKLTRAFHHRLQREVTDTLTSVEGAFVHTIPGDIIDLEFASSSSPLGTNQKETYLLRTSGFYTSLREKQRILAGNWMERISPDAKSRLASLARLRYYS